MLLRAIALFLVLPEIGACRVGFEVWVDDGGTEDSGVRPDREDYSEAQGEGEVGGDDSAMMPWGRYCATLAIPECPGGAELVVDTTTTELEGGATLADPAAAGENLSLVEAMTIAANRPGPDTVRFDPAVFPAEAPATIVVGDEVNLSLDTTDLCLDGRNRGVIVRWDGLRVWNIWGLGDRARMIGLTLLGPPFEMDQSGGQVACCRFNTDGTTVYRQERSWLLEPSGSAEVGPGNVFAGEIALRIFAGGPIIHDNYFGFDPVTGNQLSLVRVLDLRSSCPVLADCPRLVRNLLAATGTGSWASWAEPEVGAVLEDNRIGVDPAGRPLSTPVAGLSFGSGHYTVGPGNVLANLAQAIEVWPDVQVRITRNRIYGNAAAISFSGSVPVDPPTILAAGSTGASGSCAVDGTVEVFADAADQGEEFLGEAACSGGAWTLTAAVPADRNVTATLTDAQGRTSAFSTPRRP